MKFLSLLQLKIFHRQAGRMSKYTFKPLQEQASDKDDLKNSPHSRISDSIASLIVNSESSLTIGLEGGWGTGKSTIVNLLKENMRKKEEHENESSFFFLFDSWSHDTNSVRKVFLTRLLDAIIHEKSKIDNSPLITKLTTEKEEILGHKKTITKKSTSSLSPVGKLLAYSLLLLPPGTAFLNIKNLDGFYLNAIHFLGFIFTLAPIITLAAYIFCFCIYSQIKLRKNPFSSLLNELEFLKSQKTDVLTETIQGNYEYSSFEFEESFKNLLKSLVLSQNEEEKGNDKLFNRVIIVIDNLDRVNYDLSLKIWNSLQTFFQLRSESQNNNKDKDKDKDKNKDEWMKKVWFIVPYDRKSLFSQWESNHTDKNALEFFEKCFQVVFDSPPVITSTWIEYFRKKLSESIDENWLKLPQEPSEPNLLTNINKEIVIKTTLRYFNTIDESPNIRKMRNIINKIGVMLNTWDDLYSPESITLYALIRPAFSKDQILDALINERFPNGYNAITSKKNLQIEIAGLLYGVEKQPAEELLLKNKIEKIIFHLSFNEINKTEKEVQKLLKNHEKLVWEELHTFLFDFLDREYNSQHELMQVTAFIFVYRKKENAQIPNELLTKLLEKWIKDSPSFDLDGENISYHLVPLLYAHAIENKSNKKLREKIVENLLIKIKSHYEGNFSENPKNLIEVLLALTKSKVLYSPITLNATAWSNWVQDINQHFFYNSTMKEINPLKYAENTLALVVNKDIKYINNAIQPNSDVLNSMLNQLSFNANGDNSVEFALLTKVLAPSVSSWEPISEKIAGFIRHEFLGTFHNPQIYYLILTTLSSNDPDNQKVVADAVRSNDYWKTTEQLYDPIPMLVIALICFDSSLSEMVTNKQILNFWLNEDKYAEDSNILVLNLIEALNVTEYIWLTSTNEKIRKANQFLEQNLSLEILLGWQKITLGINELGYHGNPVREEHIEKFIVIFGEKRDKILHLLEEETEQAEIVRWRKTFKVANKICSNNCFSELLSFLNTKLEKPVSLHSNEILEELV